MSIQFLGVLPVGVVVLDEKGLPKIKIRVHGLLVQRFFFWNFLS